MARVRRRDFLSSSAVLLAAPLLGQGQTPTIPQIGWLSNGAGKLPTNLALEEGLRDLGWVDGRTLTIARRFAAGESTRLPRMAEELVRLKVALILASDPPSLAAASAATKTIPIVTRVSNDPVSAGIVRSLAHPGGNITGVYSEAEELASKRLELLREAIPGLTLVAVLWDREFERSEYWYGETEAAARALGLTLVSIETRGPRPDFEAAIRAAVAAKAGALITFRNPPIVAGTQALAALTTRYRLPAMFDEQAFVRAGGLMAYGADLRDLHAKLAAYVDQILKGAKPGDLPIQQPSKFELVINKKTARALGLTIPRSVLFRADRVIE